MAVNLRLFAKRSRFFSLLICIEFLFVLCHVLQHSIMYVTQENLKQRSSGFRTVNLMLHISI
jgi:hypothetical protein